MHNMRYNLYGVIRTTDKRINPDWTDGDGCFIVAQSPKHAKRYAAEIMNWQYYNIGSIYLLQKDVEGPEGKCEVEEGFTLLKGQLVG